MASFDYPTLVAAKTTVGSIASWVNKTDVPSDQILFEAQEYIYHSLRVREMVNLDTVNNSLAQGANTIPQPTGYIASASLYYTGDDYAKINRAPLEFVESSFSYSGASMVQGKPRLYYASGAVLQLDCPAQQIYGYRHIVYQSLPDLSSGNPTNFLTTRCRRLLRSVCMAMASEWYKDDQQKQYWLQIAQAEIDRLNREADFEQIGDQIEVRAA